LILGDKAVNAVRAGKPGARMTKLIVDAPRFPEGTGIYLDVERGRDLLLIRKLVKIKLAH
jgi:hypothetical protein